MVFDRGNRAVRDHAADGKDLLLFQTLGRGQVRFLGQFDCGGYTIEGAPDREGNQRDAIVFELIPATGANTANTANTAIEPEVTPDGPQVSLSELRRRALEAARNTPEVRGREARRSLYLRSEAVRRYVLARAAGTCECCDKPAPFVTLQGEPYLEPHHTRRLSDGGPDDPRFVGAVCPSCHREIHHGAHGAEKNKSLTMPSTQRDEFCRRLTRRSAQVPAGRSAIVEVYPALWSRSYPRDDRTGDQHDAFVIAAAVACGRGGRLGAFLQPDLTQQ